MLVGSPQSSQSSTADRFVAGADHVDFHAVEQLLAEHLPADRVAEVLTQAWSLELTPQILWRWAHDYGVDLLVLVVKAGVEQAQRDQAQVEQAQREQEPA